MQISRTALAHGLTVGATVLTAAGAAVLAPSSDTIVPAAAAGLTALSGILLALKLTKAASVASELVPMVPTLVKLEAVAEPLVAYGLANLHPHPAAVAKVTGLAPVRLEAPK